MADAIEPFLLLKLLSFYKPLAVFRFFIHIHLCRVIFSILGRFPFFIHISYGRNV